MRDMFLLRNFMPIISNCELWFPKLDPKRPNSKFNKENPTWEVQIRTSSKEVKKNWEELQLPVKAIVPDEGAPYYRVNLKKKVFKENGENSSPVKLVNGKLEDMDPNSVGNGSLGNVRIYQYEYPKKDGGKGFASVLMGVQVTKHVLYTPKARNDEFGETETEIVEPSEDETEEF